MLEERTLNINLDIPPLDPFFDLSADLLCIAGFDGYFKRINPAVPKVLGYTNEELFSRPINDFVHWEDKDITARNRENLTKNIPLLNFENRYITKNGDIVWLSWTSMPLPEKQLVYAIAKNITHKKKQEEDRNRMLADLTKINNELKQLTYATSHDLRSPVNNLLSVFSLLDTSKIEDDETLTFIDILRDATENLKKRLNNYVDTLIQKNDLNVHIEELSLSDCLHTVKQSLSSLIEDSRTTIHADFSVAEKVKFNRAYMESVFLNLISNSIKYARTDCFPSITIKSHQVDGKSTLIFADNGIGFDMEKVKDRIFGFHQTFHNNSDSKGIGLYLVYNHITSLGGQIAIDSRVNEGTTFTISFRN